MEGWPPWVRTVLTPFGWLGGAVLGYVVVILGLALFVAVAWVIVWVFTFLGQLF